MRRRYYKSKHFRCRHCGHSYTMDQRAGCELRVCKACLPACQTKHKGTSSEQLVCVHDWQKLEVIAGEDRCVHHCRKCGKTVNVRKGQTIGQALTEAAIKNL